MDGIILVVRYNIKLPLLNSSGDVITWFYCSSDKENPQFIQIDICNYYVYLPPVLLNKALFFKEILLAFFRMIQILFQLQGKIRSALMSITAPERTLLIILTQLWSPLIFPRLQIFYLKSEKVTHFYLAIFIEMTLCHQCIIHSNHRLKGLKKSLKIFLLEFFNLNILF